MCVSVCEGEGRGLNGDACTVFMMMSEIGEEVDELEVINVDMFIQELANKTVGCHDDMQELLHLHFSSVPCKISLFCLCRREPTFEPVHLKYTVPPV